MNILAPIIIIPSLILIFLIFSYVSVPLWLWSLYFAGGLGVFQVPIWSWIIFGVVALIFNIPQLRQRIITTYLVKAIKTLKLLPKISDTERAAIEAGNVWVDGEYFSGKPNLKSLLKEPYPQITPEIRSFLDNQVEKSLSNGNRLGNPSAKRFTPSSLGLSQTRTVFWHDDSSRIRWFRIF